MTRSTHDHMRFPDTPEARDPIRPHSGELVSRGRPRAAAVAATLLFRVLTYGVEIPLGGVPYLVWQRSKRWRKSLPAAEPTAVPASPP
jgi:hypothetical protein